GLRPARTGRSRPHDTTRHRRAAPRRRHRLPPARRQTRPHARGLVLVHGLRRPDLRVTRLPSNARRRRAPMIDKLSVRIHRDGLCLPSCWGNWIRKLRCIWGMGRSFPVMAWFLRRCRVGRRCKRISARRVSRTRMAPAASCISTRCGRRSKRWASAAGVNRRSVQALLGHSDPSLTARAYTDVAGLELHSEISKLPALGKDAQKCASIAAPSRFRALSGELIALVQVVVRYEKTAPFESGKMVDATGLEP